MSETPENSGESGACTPEEASARRSDGMPVGKPFGPGDPRINRAGRPTGFAKRIRQMTGEDGADLAELAWRIARGKVKNEKPVVVDGSVTVVRVKPSAKERMEAVKFLGEQAHGKAPRTVEVSGPGGGPLQVEAWDLTGLSDEELLALQSIRTKLAPPVTDDELAAIENSASASGGDRAGDSASGESPVQGPPRR
jgi:hypothetical protein